jgi:hypothetical protein
MGDGGRSREEAVIAKQATMFGRSALTAGGRRHIEEDAA